MNHIRHEDLSKFFNHQNGGKYHLKINYHGNNNAIAEFIKQNKKKSFSYSIVSFLCKKQHSLFFLFYIQYFYFSYILYYKKNLLEKQESIHLL